MLSRVLAAVVDAAPRIVVGPAQSVPEGVRITREQPAGGGPVAALAAGLAVLDADSTALAAGLAAPSAGPATLDDGTGGAEVMPVEFVAVLAADQPFLTGTAIGALRAAAAQGGADGAVFVDGDRRHYLCGVWRIDALHRGLAALGGPDGAAVRQLLAALRVVPVRLAGPQPAPWFDCDTADDVASAERFVRRAPSP